MKLVILHGWGQDAQIWSNMADMLGKNTIVFDMPGFGKEKKVDDQWGVPEYASWVSNKIKSERSVILLGHSFGGRIATKIASENPKWLKGLILSGSPSLYRPSIKTQLLILLAKTLKPFLPIKIYHKFYSKDLTDAGNMNLENTFRKVVIYDQTDQVPKIKVPTLLIWGEKDAEAPLRIAYELKNLIKNSDLKIIKNANHDSFLDNPNLFYRYVKNFVKNIK